jgi:RNA polymerase sigma-70 factor (ECF subfamily)
MAHPDSFQSYRPLLFAIAYRMLGSASEADDVLQDAYLRYATAQAQVDGRPAEIRSLKAYLSTIVTRLCLDRLKAARGTREQYLGPWLPEPVLLQEDMIDPQHDAERHESITIAFLLLLEALAPQERAVFLLREVFEYEYAEISQALGLSAANCRQIFHRARTHLAERRPRFRPAPERQRELVARFLAATQRGDVQALANVLAQDVSFVADGGGKVAAARQPVQGRELVTKLLIKLVANAPRAVHAAEHELRLAVAEVNGEPAVLFWVRDRLDTVFVFSLGDEQIAAIHVIRNPDKLVYIQRQLFAWGADGPAPAA